MYCPEKVISENRVNDRFEPKVNYAAYEKWP